MSVRVSFGKQFIFGIMFLVIVLAVIEGIVRIWWYWFNTCPIETSEVYKDLEPAMRKQLCLDNYDVQRSSARIDRNQDLETIHINNEGFRGPEIVAEKPADTYRIFIVGGSTIFGVGATSDETTIPGFIQQLFDKYTESNFHIEVINAGVQGARSDAEIEYVKTKLVTYAPDLIIVYDGYNDIGQDAFDAPRLNDVPAQQDTLEDILRTELSFYKTPVFIKYLTTTRQSNSNSNLEAGAEIIAGSSKWMERWTGACELGKKEGFDTIVTLQPAAGTGNRILTQQEYQFYVVAEHSKILPYYDYYAEKLSELNNYCAGTADLRGVFDGVSEPIYFDSHHVGNKGNSIVAEELFKLSLPVIQKKIPNLTYSIPDAEFEDANIITNVVTPPQSSLSNVILTGKDHTGENLSSADLSGKDLTGFNFYGANLSGASLRGANLRGANLHSANLSGADLSESDLSGATLAGVNLTLTNLSGANLSGVNLVSVNLSGKDMKFMTMPRANLTYANILGVDFTGADLSGVDLSYVDISVVKFTAADLSGVDLSGIDLSHKDFSGANLSGALLSGANLARADLSNANLDSANLSHAYLVETTLSNAILTNANLSEANLQEARTNGAVLEGANLSCINNEICKGEST